LCKSEIQMFRIIKYRFYLIAIKYIEDLLRFYIFILNTFYIHLVRFFMMALICSSASNRIRYKLTIYHI